VAKDFGAGTVVVFVNEKGKNIKIFTAPCESDLALTD
jgi:hypothetical protein